MKKDGRQSTKVLEATTIVLIRNVPREKYRQFRGAILRKHGMTVVSWFRKMIDKELL